MPRKILGLVTVVLSATVVTAVGLDHNRPTFLPRPGGRFPVGHTTLVWTDARQDPLAPPGTSRELVAWIWYPATASSQAPFSDYLPAPWQRAVEHQNRSLFERFLTRDLSRVRAHGIWNADLTPERPQYPVVLMCAAETASTSDYTTLAEDLASHGFVVVGVDAPYRSPVVVLPEGKVIARSPQNSVDEIRGPDQQRAQELVQDWVADMRFALDQLEKLNASDPSGRFRSRLNLERVGIFGHSLGGAEALEFCHDDSRCRAGADVDGAPIGTVVSEGVTQPFLFLLSDHSRQSQADNDPMLKNIRAIYIRLPAARRLQIVIHGANHENFSDRGMLKTSLLRRVLRAAGLVRLDPRRQTKVSAHYITTFFDVFLRNGPPSRLQNRPDYSEAETVQ